MFASLRFNLQCQSRNRVKSPNNRVKIAVCARTLATLTAANTATGDGRGVVEARGADDPAVLLLALPVRARRARHAQPDPGTK